MPGYHTYGENCRYSEEMIISPLKRYYTRATLDSAGRCVALLVGSSREHEQPTEKKGVALIGGLMNELYGA